MRANLSTLVTLGLSFQASAARCSETSISPDMRSPRTPGSSPNRVWAHTKYLLVGGGEHLLLLWIITFSIPYLCQNNCYFLDNCSVLVWTYSHSAPQSEKTDPKTRDEPISVFCHYTNLKYRPVPLPGDYRWRSTTNNYVKAPATDHLEQIILLWQGRLCCSIGAQCSDSWLKRRFNLTLLSKIGGIMMTGCWVLISGSVVTCLTQYCGFTVNLYILCFYYAFYRR